MQNPFLQAISFSRRADIETNLDTFLSLAVVNNVFKVKVRPTTKKDYTKTEIANIINQFYKSKLPIEDSAVQLLEMFAFKNGIKAPQLCVKNQPKSFIKKIAASSTENFIILYKSDNMSCIENILSFAHESQHLYQFYKIKQYLKGHDVETKYKIMAFQQIFDFCDIKTTKLDRITKKDYWFNAMEIDARKTSSEFLLNLANNQQLYPSLQKQLKNYIFYNLEDSLVLMDSGKHLLKQLNYQAKKFKKEFEGCPLADAILQEYNSIMPSIKAYTTELNNFAFGLDVQIDNIKHQDMATLQLVKMQPNH